MNRRYRHSQSSNAQILPGTELALVSTKQARSVLEHAHSEAALTHFGAGLSGILQALGPCPSPAALRADSTHPSESHFWVALDWCYWRVEPGGLRWLAHADALAISAAESEQLFAELQTIFSDGPVRVLRARSGALSLLCEKSLAAPQALYPDQLLGADMKAHLPGLTIWQRWLNEVQMQLAGSQINQDRAKNAQVPINSVWFWGAEAITTAGPSLALRYDGDDSILRARATMTAKGSPVHLHDWRELDQDTLLRQLELLPSTTKLLCSEGYLYELSPPTLSGLTHLRNRLARWFGMRK